MALLGLAFIGGAAYVGIKQLRHYEARHLHAKAIKEQLAELAHDSFSLLAQIDARYQTFIKTNIDPLFGGKAREQQMQMLASETQLQVNPGLAADKARINRYLGLSLSIVGLATLANLLFPPLLILTTAGVLILTLPAYQAAYHSIRYERRVKTELITALYLSCMWLNGYFVFGALVSALFFMGLKIAFQIEDRSREGIRNVFGQQPRFAWRWVDGMEVQVAVAELCAGDIIIVNAGEPIPVDGLILEGNASIDQRMLTGESQPAEKSVGDKVFAATLLLSGRVQIVVERAGQETTVAKIAEILTQTSNYQTKIESQGMALADKSALPSLLLSLAAYPLRGFVGATAVLGAGFGLNLRTCSMISTLNYLQIAARNMVLIKEGRALERLQQVDTIVFDKTGTLTQEQPTVIQLYCCQNEISADQLLTFAAAAEYRQSHPIAKAILSAANERNLALPPIDAASYEVGYGIKVTVEGRMIRVGSDRFMALEAISIPDSMQAIQAACRPKGHALVMVADDTQLLGAIELQATLRPEVAGVVNDLHQRGLSLAILSGDQEEPTRALSQALGIETYFANTLPENKAAVIEQLQKAGRRVCFIGDGINDAIALKQADVSISLHGATTIATDTAQIILMDQSLAKLGYLFDLTKSFDETIQKGLLTTLVPGILCIGGVFFLNFGIIAVELLFQLGFITGLGVAMQPLVQEKHRNQIYPNA